MCILSVAMCGVCVFLSHKQPELTAALLTAVSQAALLMEYPVAPLRFSETVAAVRASTQQLLPDAYVYIVGCNVRCLCYFIS
jgi:uncharacterized membrane protein (DUF441 family)